MALYYPTVDEDGLLPPDMEERLAAPLATKADLVAGKVPAGQLPLGALVTDTTVAAQVNAPNTGAAIDERINAQVTPVVEQITADYIASDQSVIDAAVAAVDANPTILEMKDADDLRDAKVAVLEPLVRPAMSSKTRATAYGDSLTHGGSNGEIWPETDGWVYKLQSEIPGLTVTNHGYSGATVDEMLFRAGVDRYKYAVATSTIPSSGAVQITTAQVMGVSREFTVNGWLDGIYGIWQRLADGTTQFNTYGASPEHSVEGDAEFVPEKIAIPTDLAVVWIGRNDVTFSTSGMESTVADHIVAGTQRLVDWLTPQVKHVMILGLTTRTNETTGMVNHNIVTEINDRLRALFPGWFKSIQAYLMNDAMSDMGITPTQADLDNIAAGTLPPSVLDVGDNTHISKATAAILPNKFFAPFLRGKGWVAKPVPVAPINGAIAHFAPDNLSFGQLLSWSDEVSSQKWVAGSTGEAPTVTTDTAGRKVVRFDGTTDILNMALALPQPFTVVVVGAYRTLRANAHILSSGGNTTYSNNLGMNAAMTAYTYAAGSILTLNKTPDTAPHVFVVSVNGATSALRVDADEATGNAGAKARSTVRAGQLSTSGGTGFDALDIYEVAILGHASDATERSALYAQLAAKHGLA